MYRSRLLGPDNSQAYINHPGPCRAADNGKPIYDNNANKYNHHTNSYSYGHQNNYNNNYSHNSNSYDRANSQQNSSQNWKRKPVENAQPPSRTPTTSTKATGKQSNSNDNYFFIFDKDPRDAFVGKPITSLKGRFVITPKNLEETAEIEARIPFLK